MLRRASYDPGAGRFTQADPYPANLLGPSRYAYAGCNPTNFVDPTGLSHCSVVDTVFAGFGAVGSAGLFLFSVGASPFSGGRRLDQRGVTADDFRPRHTYSPLAAERLAYASR